MPQYKPLSFVGLTMFPTQTRIFLIIFFCLQLSRLFGQSSELGIFMGGSRYTGDLDPNFLSVKFIHPAGGLMYRHNWNPHYSWKGTVTYGTVSAADAGSSDPFMANRNLSFKSTLIEGSAQIEFNFFPYEIGSLEYSGATPYVFTGFSGFYFNPKTEYNGSWYELQLLRTEGKAYSLISFAIPMGIGLKFRLGNFTMGVEAGARKTFTDHLDDVSATYFDQNSLSGLAAVLADRSVNADTSAILTSGRQRGTSSDKDWYTFAGIIISFKISGKPRVNCESFEKKYY